MCTLMLYTLADAPPCPLWHASGHLWSSGAKDAFHSSEQLFVGGVATRSHSSHDTNHKDLSDVVRSELGGGRVNGARGVGDPRPVQRPRKFSFKSSRLERGKWACAPLCYSCHPWVPELSFGLRLQHWRIRCRVHGFIEKVRSGQVMWYRTGLYHHMQWSMCHLLRETGIRLWPNTTFLSRALG